MIRLSIVRAVKRAIEHGIGDRWEDYLDVRAARPAYMRARGVRPDQADASNMRWWVLCPSSSPRRPTSAWRES